MRRSELILAAYFTYTSVLALALPLRAPVPAVTVVVNLSVLASYALLIHAHSLRGNELLSVMRDWFPLVLVLLAYREMGWFRLGRHTFALENRWVVWDRMVLRDWGVHKAIESFGPVLPSLLEIAYALVYAIGPFAVAMLYAYGARKRVDWFLAFFLLGAFLSYAQFVFWPSEPPRTVFPGEDAPSFATVFRRFNWFLLGGYGIHTSVFPSAHVSSAFAAAFGMLHVLPERKWVGRFLVMLATMIAIATVYGRYHYVVDAVAGLAVSVVASALGLLVERSSA